MPFVPTWCRGTFGKNDGNIEVITGQEPHLFKRAVFSFTSRAFLLVLIGVHHVTVARLRVRVKGFRKDSHIGHVSRE